MVVPPLLTFLNCMYIVAIVAAASMEIQLVGAYK